MKKYIISSMLTAVAALGLTSCLEEFEPTSMATATQVEQSSKKGLCDAVAGYMTSYSTSQYWNIGYAAFLTWRDAQTSDSPIYDSTYDYFSTPGSCTYLSGYYDNPYQVWKYYYALIQKSNLVMSVSNVEEPGDDAPYIANSLAYRAMAYFELTQWFEYRHTGFPTLDDAAQEMGIMGLTAPLITENTTEAEARNNPRLPFWEMYRFIITDLNNAEKVMNGQPEPSDPTNAGMGVIKGLQARVWLTLATRFDKHPEDLAEALAHEDDADVEWNKLGITTAVQGYQKALDAAKMAQRYAGSPVTESQWYDPKSGFNTVNQAWMWAVVITTDNKLASNMTWQSWVSFNAPEAYYGVASSDFNGYRCINAALFDQIADGDWRRETWIDPADVASEKAYKEKYQRGTILSYDEWAEYDLYCGFKYHPAGGNNTTATAGNAVSIPLMRVEEMMLIEAEATGRVNGDAAGRAVLESFMNSYRMASGMTYKSLANGMDGFIEDVFTQKRIELWGEGQCLWDYRRLEHAVIRGYQGTNWIPLYRFNSNENAVAPWSTMSIPELEQNYNPACKLNPDPSYPGNYTKWE